MYHQIRRRTLGEERMGGVKIGIGLSYSTDIVQEKARAPIGETAPPSGTGKQAPGGCGFWQKSCRLGLSQKECRKSQPQKWVARRSRAAFYKKSFEKGGGSDLCHGEGVQISPDRRREE